MRLSAGVPWANGRAYQFLFTQLFADGGSVFVVQALNNLVEALHLNWRLERL